MLQTYFGSSHSLVSVLQHLNDFQRVSVSEDQSTFCPHSEISWPQSSVKSQSQPKPSQQRCSSHSSHRCCIQAQRTSSHGTRELTGSSQALKKKGEKTLLSVAHICFSDQTICKTILFSQTRYDNI